MPDEKTTSDTYGIFYQHAQLNGQHFADTGKKKYDDVVMVEVFVKGSTKASISKRVFDNNGEPITMNLQGDTYPEIYPKAYKAFIREGGNEIDGTPLKLMGGAGPGQIMNLNAMGIESIEDLAELNDNVVIGEPGMLDLRKKARAYIASMNPEIAAAKEAEKEEEMELMRKEVQEMKDALAQATIIESTKAPRKRRKRNPETGQLE